MVLKKRFTLSLLIKFSTFFAIYFTLEEEHKLFAFVLKSDIFFIFSIDYSGLYPSLALSLFFGSRFLLN